MAKAEEDATDAADVVRAAEIEYDADIYLYSAAIDHKGYGRIVQSFNRTRPNALLLLTTNGGLANSAYKIARFFQNQYEHFTICIPSVCKSAGTLLAVGAHDLIMGPFSELGPLDVQLYERDEIFSRKSGLLSHSAFEALKRETFDVYEHILLSIKARSGDNISFSVASAVAGEMTTGLLAPIYEQISPTGLGSDYRDLQVAVHYGQRLAMYSGNIEPAHVDWLTENYPSHDFIIDEEEARQMFKNIDGPTDALWKLIGTFAEIMLSEREDGLVLRLSDIASEVANDDEASFNGGEESHGKAEVAGSPARNRPRANRTRAKGSEPAEGSEAAKVEGSDGNAAKAN
ncbi:hypothetical protein [Mesorhizobium sp. B2-5-3]|uniref:SDH family Clp fold serine proteinase n=1 Tax=Mesorhizobium sp. B2-5-3 TaxID=2589927 RepID=UPI00112EC0B0|nr:hypothetical protein [Mesorhizobium sp. B2-5-3]TPK38716.1 hypothetical protein FJ867_08915 [Mesorhizobium sp. B2-5-3]